MQLAGRLRRKAPSRTLIPIATPLYGIQAPGAQRREPAAARIGPDARKPRRPRRSRTSCTLRTRTPQADKAAGPGLAAHASRGEERRSRLGRPPARSAAGRTGRRAGKRLSTLRPRPLVRRAQGKLPGPTTVSLPVWSFAALNQARSAAAFPIALVASRYEKFAWARGELTLARRRRRASGRRRSVRGRGRLPDSWPPHRAPSLRAIPPKWPTGA